MPFQITKIKRAFFPSEALVRQALDLAQVPSTEIEAAIEGFTCTAPLAEGQGYQMSIAHELERHLSTSLTHGKPVYAGGGRYSPRLNEKADLVIGLGSGNAKVFFEVEFRPNVEKDLVKFQIGYNTGSLAVAVLILALDRTAINARYTTMPEFDKFQRVIGELAPTYPLLLIGIHGEHREAAA
jgi:hypothetical protein